MFSYDILINSFLNLVSILDSDAHFIFIAVLLFSMATFGTFSEIRSGLHMHYLAVAMSTINNILCIANLVYITNLVKYALLKDF